MSKTDSKTRKREIRVLRFDKEPQPPKNAYKNLATSHNISGYRPRMNSDESPYDMKTCLQQIGQQATQNKTFQSLKKPVEKSPSFNYFDSKHKSKFNFNRGAANKEEQRSKSWSNDSKEGRNMDGQSDFVISKSRRSQSEESKKQDNKSKKQKMLKKISQMEDNGSS